MFTQLRVQNFRSIAELTLELGAKNLLMGQNGAGKTSIFDALADVRALVVGGKRLGAGVDEVFPLSSLPRWLQGEKQTSFEQRFGIDVEGESGCLRYELLIEQDASLARSRVFSETLALAGRPLFEFRAGKVQLYRDDHSPGAAYSADWNRSAMEGVPSGPDNRQMACFKQRMRNIHCLRIDAPGMMARSERESVDPDRNLSNFASWYRRALIADAAAGAEFLAAIRQVIGGMDSLNLAELGQGIMVLQATFAQAEANSGGTTGRPRKTFRLDFNELSHGQQALIGLYALLSFVVRENDTLCIDEPDNFVGLAEIQPWLFELQDRVDDRGAQVLIASHHPELLNMLAVDHGIVLERDGSGPTTARRYAAEPGSALKPAERIARGWDRE